MNIAHLKSKILDLAVRGKLTEQRPEDGSAAELLGRVREEKQRLIAAGKIKKEKTLPEMTEDEKPFNIPAGWEWCRLPELCIKAITDGTHNSPPQQRQGDFLYITAKNIKDNGIDLTNVSYVTREIHNQIYARCNPEKGDVLLTKDGTIGIATVNNLDYPFSMLSSIALIKPVTQLLPWYLTYVLRSPYWQTLMHSDSKGSALRRIILEQINSFIVPLPPLAEQKRIVEKIEQLFRQADIIEQNRLALKTRIRQTRSRVLDLAVRGKLTEQRPEDGSAEELLERIREEKQRLIAGGKLKKEKPLPEITEEEIPFDIPAGWKWVRLNDIANIERGGSPRPIADFLTKNQDGVNWIKIGDTKKGDKYIESAKEKIIPEGVKYSRFVHAGDFLLTNSMSFGRPYILKINGCIHDGWLVFSNILSCISSEYLYYLLSSSFIYNAFTLSAAGSTVKNLNIDRVKEVFFPLPPLAEQKRIVEKTEQIFGVLDIIENAVEG